MQKICVFCGSSSGARPEYVQMAETLGRALARRNLALVYGGAKVGLMGRVAQAVLAEGGDAIGVIPQSLYEMEVAFDELPTLHVVSSMHERKALMTELADGFIALPGGMGTFEELFEVLTWAQLGMHHKPCALLNVAGYYDQLIAFLEHALAEQFIKTEHRDLVLVAECAEVLLDAFATYQPPHIDKAAWILQMSKM